MTLGQADGEVLKKLACMQMGDHASCIGWSSACSLALVKSCSILCQLLANSTQIRCVSGVQTRKTCS
jgi:hypothetical protein